jgi:hypothetical protein
VVPLKCSTSVLLAPDVVYEPTASQLVADTHDTPPSRVDSGLATFNVALIDHADPFHFSANVLTTPPTLYCPTATHIDAATHDTENKLIAVPAGFGLDLIDHAVPFQCSIRVFMLPDVVELPTPTQNVADEHDTALN